MTAELPKCLVEIDGLSLLEHQFRLLDAVGIENICIVVGYKAESVAEQFATRATLIENDIWAETNSLYSLSLCSDWIHGPVVVMNCDVLVDPRILQNVLSAPGSSFAFDSTSGLDPEEMAVQLNGGVLQSMSKTLPTARTDGENVGLLRFDTHTADLLLAEAHALLTAGAKNEWLASAVERVARRTPLFGVDINGLDWIEIDFPTDLSRARQRAWRS